MWYISHVSPGLEINTVPATASIILATWHLHSWMYHYHIFLRMNMMNIFTLWKFNFVQSFYSQSHPCTIVAIPWLTDMMKAARFCQKYGNFFSLMIWLCEYRMVDKKYFYPIHEQWWLLALWKLKYSTPNTSDIKNRNKEIWNSLKSLTVFVLEVWKVLIRPTTPAHCYLFYHLRPVLRTQYMYVLQKFKRSAANHMNHANTWLSTCRIM